MVARSARGRKRRAGRRCVDGEGMVGCWRSSGNRGIYIYY